MRIISHVFALNLLLSEVLAPGEVVGELAAPELDGVGTSEVGAAGGKPLLVVQLLMITAKNKRSISSNNRKKKKTDENIYILNGTYLVGLALLEVLVDDSSLGRSGGGRDSEDGSQTKKSSAAALGRHLHPLGRRRGCCLRHRRGGLKPDDARVHAGHVLSLMLFGLCMLVVRGWQQGEGW